MIKIVMHDVDYSPEIPSFDVIDTYFDGDWRRGKEMKKVTITNRLYQISPGVTKARFSNKVQSQCVGVAKEVNNKRAPDGLGQTLLAGFGVIDVGDNFDIFHDIVS